MKQFLFWVLISSLSINAIPAANPIDDLLDSLEYFDSLHEKFSYLDRILTKAVYANPMKALMISVKYDSLARETKNLRFLTQAKVALGMGYYASELYEESLDHYIAALKNKDALASNRDRAQLLNNIATTYQIIGDLEKSVNYYEQAFDIYQREQDSLWMANINGNLGLLLLNNQKIDQAEPRIRAALAYFLNVVNSTFEGFTLLNLANLLNEKNDFDQSIPHYERAMELVPQRINPLLSAAAHAGIGVAYSSLGNFDKAKHFLELGLAEATQINHNEQMIACFQELAELYEKNGFPRKALWHFKNYFNLKDSVFTLQKDEKMVEMLAKYESEKKEKEIAILNSERMLDQARIKNSRKLLLFFGIGLLVLGCLLWWVLQLNKRIKKGADEKETLLKEIHHRVKNNLQVVSALLTLQSKYLGDDQAKVALQKGQDRVRSMALIHQDLYQHNNLKGVNTKDYLTRLVDNLMESYNLTEREIVVNLDIDSIWLDVDTMIPLGLLINELVSNAMKHAFVSVGSGRLDISLHEEGRALLLSVRDNGPGSTNLDFNNDKTFGFSLIRSFAKKLDAEIVTNVAEGFSVRLKIHNYQKAA